MDVRITPANITAQASKPLAPTPNPAADQTSNRRQQTAARDSYNKNASLSSPPVIDAEYVDFPRPGSQLFDKERINLDNTIEAVKHTSNDAITSRRLATQSRYPLKVHDAPPPGSLIDTFA